MLSGNFITRYFMLPGCAVCCQGGVNGDMSVTAFVLIAMLECPCVEKVSHIILIIMCSFLCHFSFGAQGPLHETN